MCPLPVPQSQCATLAWQGPSPLQDVLARAAPATAPGAVSCLRGSLSQVLPLSTPSWTDPAWKDPAGCSCVDCTGYWRPCGVTVLVPTLWPPAVPRPTIPPRIRCSCWISKGWAHVALLMWQGKVQPRGLPLTMGVSVWVLGVLRRCCSLPGAGFPLN